MTGHAAQPHVGMVGAKLLYPDSSVIQHIGITNLVIGPSHSQIGFSDKIFIILEETVSNILACCYSGLQP